jgi:cytidine deaminase
MSESLKNNIISKLYENKIHSHEGFFHIALIPNNKGFISSTNDYNRTVLQKKFIFSLHAEVSALHKFNNIFRNNPNKKIKELIVLRLNRRYELRNSKPCKKCIETMLENNVKYVIYSENDGSMTKIKVKDLFNSY